MQLSECDCCIGGGRDLSVKQRLCLGDVQIKAINFLFASVRYQSLSYCPSALVLYILEPFFRGGTTVAAGGGGGGRAEGGVFIINWKLSSVAGNLGM